MHVLSPDAIDVQVAGKDLHVSFDNGELRRFDLSPLLHRKCYARLNDPLFRSKAYIQHGCVTWPGNIDIDPDWLYEDSVTL